MRILASMRVAAGLTRRQLADLLGVDEDAVVEWERGLLCPPQHLLRDYAAAVQCSVWALRDAINAERLKAGCPRCDTASVAGFRSKWWF